MGNPRAILMAAVILGWTAGAGAQTTDRRVELGIGAGGAASWWIQDLPAVVGPEMRVSIPTSDQKSIEVLGGVSTVRIAGDTVGFYGVQRQRRLRSEPESKVESFISYGVIGVFFQTRSPEYRSRAANGSTIISPASSRTVVVPPFIGLLGGGTERQMSPRLKARLDVQAVMALVVPVAVRVSTGVSVGLGKTR